MLKIITIILLLFVSGCAAMSLIGCVSGHYHKEIITADARTVTDVDYASLMKDVSLDPNGVVSVTSPKAENIVTAIGSFMAGWWIK